MRFEEVLEMAVECCIQEIERISQNETAGTLRFDKENL